MSDQTPGGPKEESLSSPPPQPQNAPTPDPPKPDLLDAILSGKLEDLAGPSPDHAPEKTEENFEELVAAAAKKVDLTSDPDQQAPEQVQPAGDLSDPPAGDGDREDDSGLTGGERDSDTETPAPSAPERPAQHPEAARKPKPKSRPAPQQARRSEPPVEVPALIAGPMAVVRFGSMFSVGQFQHSLKTPPACGEKVVVRTHRGTEIGVVTGGTSDAATEEPATQTSRESGDASEEAAPPCEGSCWGHRGWMSREDLARYTAAPGEEYPLREEGRILRIANTQDLIDCDRLAAAARQEAAFCQQTAREMKLDMKIVGVDHLLGGDRILFYFTSATRIDFRKLVQKLSAQYHTRIEMRQVGARDEARLVADYEKCGQQCCCKRFLKDLKPVSMRMAKMQKASLDPTKISGRCGRLMCCMRYEDATYQELRKGLPKKKTFVRTAEGVGKVLDTQIITQLVQLGMPDGTIKAVGLEEILERNVTAPPPRAAPTRRPQRERGPRTPLRDAVVSPATGAAVDTPTSKAPDSAATSASAAPAESTPRPAAESEGTAKKKRRRGRRKRRGKKSSGSGGSSGSQ